MTYGSNVGLTDFDTVNFPNDGNPAWTEAALGNRVQVDN
jgi:hypothetical protein